MKTFRDNQGRPWELAMTIGAAKRIRSRLGVDIMALHDGTPPLVERILGDLALQVDLVYVCIEPQVRAAGITDEQWAESMGGGPMAEALEAFWQEIIDFFRPGRPGTAEMARTALEMVRLRQLAAASVGQSLRDGPPSTSSPGSPAAAAPTA
jgi:hypothetical protein